MNVFAVLVILLMASGALALPFLLMRIASSGRESLLQVIRLAAVPPFCSAWCGAPRA